MKKIITLFVLSAFALLISSCAKDPVYPAKTVKFQCSGGSGSYTMTYSNNGNVQQGNYSEITYTLNQGQSCNANAFDNNGNTFTFSVIVNGSTVQSYTGTMLSASYDY